MLFIVCSTNEDTFEDLLGYVVVVGCSDRFVMVQDEFDSLPEEIQSNVSVIKDDV